MLEMFKRAKKFFLILAIPYIAGLVVLLFPMEARIIAPGNITATEGFLSINREWKTENPYHSIFVMSFDRPTLFQYGMGRVSTTLRLDDIPPVERRVRNPYETGQAQRRLSFRAAMIATLKELDMQVEYTTYTRVNAVYRSATHEDIAAGERILSVNGREDVRQALMEAPCGAEVELVVQDEAREEEPRTIKMRKVEVGDGECVFGLALVDGYEIDYGSIHPEIIFRRDWTDFVGGPSGGLMQALYFHYALTGEDLSGERIITGTGTIDADGNVGLVGGVREKVITAAQKGADVMFVPLPSLENDANYTEALETRDEFGFALDIVPVSSMKEAIDHLRKIGGDNDE